MKATKCFPILTAIILFVFCSVSPVLPSQIANHIRVARLARDHTNTPQDIRRFLLRYSDFYDAGAAGPDIIGNVLSEEGRYPTAKNAHYKKTGGLLINMFKLSNQEKDITKREQHLAYTLGWMTHYFLDIQEHKVVNDYGGLYKFYPERHIALEMLETAHVYESSGHKTTLPYIVFAKGLPIDLVRRAFNATYSRSFGDHLPPTSMIPGAASRTTKTHVSWAALLMERFTRVTLRQFRAQLEVSSPETFRFGRYGLGHIPMRKEYWNILQPIDVRVEELTGDKNGVLAAVKWHITDTTLQVGYLTDWYKANSLAIEQIVSIFRRIGAGRFLEFPDMNLDSGDPETAGYSQAKIISGKFKNIRELELEWKILSKNGKTLYSDKKNIQLRNFLADWETRYVKHKEGTLRISVPAKTALFCRSNQKLSMKVRLRMLNNNTHLMKGRYATSFKFVRGTALKGVKVDQSQKVPIEAHQHTFFSNDMPGLYDCDHRERCTWGTHGNCLCKLTKPGKVGRYAGKWVIQKDHSKCNARRIPEGHEGSRQGPSQAKEPPKWGGMDPRQFSPQRGIGSQ